MANMEKEMGDVSRERNEFDETIKDISKLHDKLLKMGFGEVAEDVLRIHDRLLVIEGEKTRRNVSKQFDENEEEGGAILQHQLHFFLEIKRDTYMGRLE